MSYLNSVSIQKGSTKFDIPFDRQQMADYLNIERTALSKELRKMRDEEELQGVIAKEKEKYDLEIDGLLGQKLTLEHKNEKLLEAHYNDAIPMELLKAEQEKITKELAAINHEIKQHDITFDQLSKNLTNALELLDDVATFYRNGSDFVKRMLNQAIFEKIYVSCSKEVPLEIEAEYRPPFNTIIEPFKANLPRSTELSGQAPRRHLRKS